MQRHGVIGSRGLGGRSKQADTVGNSRKSVDLGGRHAKLGSNHRVSTGTKLGERKNHFMSGFFKSLLHGSQYFLVSQQVNAVLNQRQRIVVINDLAFKRKSLQSSTIKANVNRFVRDKKKCYTIDGIKTTRIEFTNDEYRSANYTSNAPCVYHNIFEQFFDMLCLVQGEKITHLKPYAINNTNYTSVLYGVTNPFSAWVCQNEVEEAYTKPLLFPSHINACSSLKRHQIFASMYINTQKVKPAEAHELGLYINRFAGLLEIDEPFNKYCCELSLKRCTFLNTANKILLILLNELFYVSKANNYTTFMNTYFEKYSNDIPWQWGSLTNQYDNKHKNVTFSHLIPRFIYELWFKNAFAYIPSLIKSYASRVQKESLHELHIIVETTVEQLNPHARPGLSYTHGKLFVRGRLIEFKTAKAHSVDARTVTFLRKEICLFVRNILFSLPEPAL
ncbi:hypothetical protein [Ranid herpesvirus 3]|uniref:Uncharacterized protein n=1 Tax=Ranid herpesvirus 3 TaxID=1987509 RepID=A0A1X9T5E5_9VIRU|nr:hypothetical protein [Ranid herpesvirus 3]ARR28917.1 hypothetical protein [Ranid herpesvirus 3]